MNKTRCKVLCNKTDEVVMQDATAPKNAGGSYASVEGQTAYFNAVYSTTDPENAAFFIATPALSMTVSIARGRPFEANKSYYLDFTEAE